MRRRANLLEEARRGLEADTAKAACRVAELERRVASLKEQALDANYELLSARADLRSAVSALETHDLRRGAAS